MPYVSVYSVYAGAYIMHAPDGDAIRQLVAVPTAVYPVGQELSDIIKYSSSIVA